MSITMVQPRLVENRVYDYKAYPQTVEDELDRKDTRLVPSRQCLSTVKRPTALPYRSSTTKTGVTFERSLL